MQIIYIIYFVNLYFFVIYNTLCRILNALITWADFEVNLTQILIVIVITKMLIMIII